MVHFPCPGILHQEEIDLRVVEGKVTDTILPMSRETNKNKTQNKPQSALIMSKICYF